MLSKQSEKILEIPTESYGFSSNTDVSGSQQIVDPTVSEAVSTSPHCTRYDDDADDDDADAITVL